MSEREGRSSKGSLRMPNPGNGEGGSTEAFTKFWTDMFSRMTPPGGVGMPFAPPSPEETAKQMRQAMFDSWAKHCEDFMRSDVFLDSMKKSMDGALAFRQKLNDFLTKILQESQIPARSDTEAILLAVRRMEEKVLDRMESLTQRVEALEAGNEDRAAPGARSAVGSSTSASTTAVGAAARPSPAAAEGSPASGGSRPRSKGGSR